jgi:hypothetical protein
VKVRTNLMIFRPDGQALVKCRKCKRELVIEASLGDDLRKALDQPPRRVVVPRVRKGLDATDSAQ